MRLSYSAHAKRRARERGAPILSALPEDAEEIPGHARREDHITFEFRRRDRRWRIVLAVGDVTRGATVVSIMSPDTTDTPAVRAARRLVKRNPGRLARVKRKQIVRKLEASDDV